MKNNNWPKRAFLSVISLIALVGANEGQGVREACGIYSTPAIANGIRVVKINGADSTILTFLTCVSISDCHTFVSVPIRSIQRFGTTKDGNFALEIAKEGIVVGYFSLNLDRDGYNRLRPSIILNEDEADFESSVEATEIVCKTMPRASDVNP